MAGFSLGQWPFHEKVGSWRRSLIGGKKKKQSSWGQGCCKLCTRFPLVKTTSNSSEGMGLTHWNSGDGRRRIYHCSSGILRVFSVILLSMKMMRWVHNRIAVCGKASLIFLLSHRLWRLKSCQLGSTRYAYALQSGQLDKTTFFWAISWLRSPPILSWSNVPPSIYAGGSPESFTVPQLSNGAMSRRVSHYLQIILSLQLDELDRDADSNLSFWTR